MRYLRANEARSDLVGKMRWGVLSGGTLDLRAAAALLSLGKLSTDEAIAAASSALNRDIYCDSLGLLLFEEPIWSEVGPLFERALADLRIPIPSRDQACSILAHEYARQIIAGEISPIEGASRIWWDVVIEPEVDPSLLVFAGLASCWDDLGQNRQALEADILREARRLISAEEDE
jgi:hypothetical protein